MAAFFWIGSGANSNWTTVGNWSGTSGGASNGAAPTSTSDVTFDGVGTNGNTASTVSGTITILSLTFSSGYTNTITINTAVTLAVAGNFTDNTAHTWVVSGTGLLAITATSTITSGGKTFPGPVTFNGSGATKTLVGNWVLTGALTVATNAQVINHTTAETLTSAGFVISVAASGTIDLILSGGQWSGTGVATNNSITFAGNVLINSPINFNTGSLIYSSGSVTATGSTLGVGGSTTFNTNGITWSSINFTSAATQTLNSLLTATGVVTVSNITAITFAGTAGFTFGTFTSSAATARTITLKNGVTYTVTTALNAFLSTPAGILTITSDDAVTKAILTLQYGATCNVVSNFTRIDASLGRTIMTFNGTVTTCLNINPFNDLATVGSSFA